ncbi:hypothetical protein MTR_7g093550 [Medicago truncatula]|uniref:Uncharacterized protein n=1 Tax=Medicago truncatula TaxID=3880 RepID=G7KW99_MEDTR|nr:hypothetical protein MTR_7g093550 [Medicago truncatula]
MNSLQPQYSAAGEEDMKSKGIKRIGMVERGVCISRHNGAGWGRVLPFPSSYLILVYLPVTLPIPNGDEKLNLISVLDGFGYPRPCIDFFFF